MTARITLVTGGSRSGKSGHALALAENSSAPRLFIATCPRYGDAELESRIERHMREREGRGWRTVEEPLELERALREVRQESVVLVDCLTLWVNNLMFQRGVRTEEEMADLVTKMLGAAKAVAGSVIFVTNEVGMGIVPGDEISRRFRDLAGRCNALVAAAADDVILMVSGCPVVAKK